MHAQLSLCFLFPFLSEIDECYSLPCVNDGKCQDQIGGYVCACNFAYTGKNCEQGKERNKHYTPSCMLLYCVLSCSNTVHSSVQES